MRKISAHWSLFICKKTTRTTQSHAVCMRTKNWKLGSILRPWSLAFFGRRIDPKLKKLEVFFFFKEGNTVTKFWTHEILTRKIFRPMKNPREKYCPHEIPTRINFGPTKYPREKFRTHKIPTRKNFGTRKCPWEKISDLWNAHDGTMTLDPRY